MPATAIDLGTEYQAARVRLSAVLAALPDAKAVAVPTCPGWSAHDVAAHLLGVVVDAMEGRLTGPPGPEQTAAEVARSSAISTAEVLRRWEEVSPPFVTVVEDNEVWPAVIDVVTHEFDVRHAVDDHDGRDLPVVAALADHLLDSLQLPVATAFDLPGRTIAVGQGAPRLRCRTTPFDVLRWRMGRRSRAQLEALQWEGDPAPVLDGLSVFDPSPVDIIEAPGDCSGP